MKTQATFNTHIAKLKMMKHQFQIIPVKMIQKIRKQTKISQVYATNITR